jgi:rhodanese-related sulfurtransferase
VALLLAKYGIKDVFPLAGGMDAWLAQGFPVEMPDD